MEKKYVLIIGSSNMDLNIYSKRLPQPGETVTGGTFSKSLGGKGANQAVAAARAGSKVLFMGKIGRDEFGDEMISQLSKEGITTDFIIRDEHEHSGVAFIMIDENGENMISVAPGANATLSKEEIDKHAEIIKSASSIVVQMEIPIETITEVFDIAMEGKATKILNPAPLKPVPPKVLKKIDIIVPNEGELFRLHSLLGFKTYKDESGLSLSERILKACEDISTFGVEYIITTLGSKGSMLYDHSSKEMKKIPAFKVDAVDTVGAGDCFNGVLASCLSKNSSITDAVKAATSAASIAVTRKGAQNSMPYQNEIKNRMKEYNKIIKIL